MSRPKPNNAGDDRSALRRLPRVDDLLAHPLLAELVGRAPHSVALSAARDAVAEAREQVRRGEDISGLDSVASRAAELLQDRLRPSLRRCINATGVILHTGLGRAPFSAAAQSAVAEVTKGYSNVQADIATGRRANREAHVEWLLEQICGAPSGLVVNNNAAATVLVLNTLAADREVIVSRGELIEIGGAFRLPDIIRLAGCRLVEVGCTNRTHLRDYEQAITSDTALLLSIHQSNYVIQGFASQVDIREIARLAKSRNLVCAHDLGSGALVDLRRFGLPYEPVVRESLEGGADVAFFSGDKLLGGPQCGVIVGDADLLRSMRRNPFYRTFRVDKLTLAALESTLRLFLDTDALPETHRVIGMLTASPDEVKSRAEGLAQRVRERCGSWLRADVREGESQVGGGSLAGHALPTALVALVSDRVAPLDLARRLRAGDPPVFSRVGDDAVLLDPRTMEASDDAPLVHALERVGRSLG